MLRSRTGSAFWFRLASKLLKSLKIGLKICIVSGTTVVLTAASGLLPPPPPCYPRMCCTFILYLLPHIWPERCQCCCVLSPYPFTTLAILRDRCARTPVGLSGRVHG